MHSPATIHRSRMRYRSKSARSIHVTSADFMNRALWGTSGKLTVGSKSGTATLRLQLASFVGDGAGRCEHECHVVRGSLPGESHPAPLVSSIFEGLRGGSRRCFREALRHP